MITLCPLGWSPGDPQPSGPPKPIGACASGRGAVGDEEVERRMAALPADLKERLFAFQRAGVRAGVRCGGR